MVSALAVVGSVIAIALAGPRLSSSAQRLADLLGVHHAVGGAVFLGLTTSLSGTVVSVSAALRGDASLALSNGLGGIAAQTAFLAVADFFHRRNLEHDSASVANLFQLGLLMLLLSLVMTALAAPELAVWRLHPVSLLLPVVWAAGTVLAGRIGRTAPWVAGGAAEGVESDRTLRRSSRRSGRGRTGDARGLPGAALWFLLSASVVCAAGYLLTVHAPVLSDRAGMSRSAAGFLITATATSLPELVTTIAAVRRGALALAVGNIIGGNAFDTLFCSLSDAAYAGGSIYAAAGAGELMATALGLVMTSLLLLGLIGREKTGLAKVGTESALLLVVYVAGAVMIALGG